MKRAFYLHETLKADVRICERWGDTVHEEHQRMYAQSASLKMHICLAISSQGLLGERGAGTLEDGRSVLLRLYCHYPLLYLHFYHCHLLFSIHPKG